MSDNDSFDPALSMILSALQEKSASRLTKKIRRHVTKKLRASKGSPVPTEAQLAIAIDCLLHEFDVPLWITRTRELLDATHITWASPVTGKTHRLTQVQPLGQEERNALEALVRLRATLPATITE